MLRNFSSKTSILGLAATALGAIGALLSSIASNKAMKEEVSRQLDERGYPNRNKDEDET